MKASELIQVCDRLQERLTNVLGEYTWTVLPDYADLPRVGISIFTKGGREGCFYAANPGFDIYDTERLKSDSFLQNVVDAFIYELADGEYSSVVKVWKLSRLSSCPRDILD